MGASLLALAKSIYYIFQNVSVKAVMTQTFPPGVRSKFSIRRRDNHALGVILGRYIFVVKR